MLVMFEPGIERGSSDRKEEGTSAGWWENAC